MAFNVIVLKHEFLRVFLFPLPLKLAAMIWLTHCWMALKTLYECLSTSIYWHSISILFLIKINTTISLYVFLVIGQRFQSMITTSRRTQWALWSHLQV